MIDYSKPLKVRFAPSPTGYMHIGALRQILLNVFLSKKTGSKWMLRIEDTDRNRLDPDAFKNFMESLEILNLDPKEGATYKKTDDFNEFYKLYQTGNYGPYIQSLRTEIYHKHADEGIERGIFYWSNISPLKRTELVETKQKDKIFINWFEESEKSDKDIMFLPVKEVLSNKEKYPNACLRFKLMREGKVVVDDLLLGEMEFDLSIAEDPVFLKGDGFPTYALAHLIDDQLMDVDIAIRTQEWVASSGVHRQAYIDFWGIKNVKLRYLHAPFVLGEQGNKKMSKRDGKVNMAQYLEKGYLPEAMINYLSFLGWNPGTEKEMYF